MITASEALWGLLVRLLDLEGSWGKGSEMLLQRLGAVLDDEEKVAGEAYLFYSRGRRRYVSLDGERCRFGRVLVSRIVAGNDRTRTLAEILTRTSCGSGRRSGGGFTSTRWRGVG